MHARCLCEDCCRLRFHRKRIQYMGVAVVCKLCDGGRACDCEETPCEECGGSGLCPECDGAGFTVD